LGYFNAKDKPLVNLLKEQSVDTFSAERLIPEGMGANLKDEFLTSEQFFCLDDYYDSDRPSYYRILRSVDQKTLDITRWLEYFVEGVKVSIAAVKDSVVRLSSERLRKTMKGQIALTEKQMKIVEFINQNDHITNRNVQEMFKISSQAAHKELVKLVQSSVIEPIGKGRSLVYRIKLS
jgi:Fic family protein